MRRMRHPLWHWLGEILQWTFIGSIFLGILWLMLWVWTYIVMAKGLW